MRISTNQFQQNSLLQMTTTFARLSAAQMEVSTGRRINAPSDDPTGTAQSLTLQNHLDVLEQYNRTLTQAKGYLNTTDGALSSVSELVRQARTLAVQAGSTTTTKEAEDSLAAQVQSIIKSLGTIGNSTYGNRYLFAGQRSDTTPFVENTTGGFDYKGGQAATNDDAIRLDVGVGDSVQVNVSGEEAILPVIQVLTELRDRIKGGQTALISNDSLSKLDSAVQNVSRIRADVGSRTQHIDTVTQQNVNAKASFSKTLSDIQDVDIPTAVVELQSAQTAYQAALQSTARIGQISLLDFLR